MHPIPRRHGFFWVVVAQTAALLIAMITLPSAALAQERLDLPTSSVSEAVKYNTPPPKTEMKSTSDNVGWMSTKESALSIAVLLFGFSLTLMQVLIIRNGVFTPNDVVRLFGLTFIVTAVLFIITAGYGAEQIAPAMGLFGTIAGYILGRNQGEKDDQSS